MKHIAKDRWHNPMNPPTAMPMMASQVDSMLMMRSKATMGQIKADAAMMMARQRMMGKVMSFIYSAPYHFSHLRVNHNFRY